MLNTQEVEGNSVSAEGSDGSHTPVGCIKHTLNITKLTANE